jgi:hypothetical protein
MRIKDYFGPASQAEMYLGRALEEFHHSANAPDLWVPVDALHRDSIVFEGAQAGLTARNRRLHFLRGTVLFAALSAEAFTNELLDELLDAEHFDELDREPTLAKLIAGIKQASSDPPVDVGSQPLQGVRTVLKTRDALVHPKPKGGIAAWVQDVEESDEERIGPKAALDAILRVAEMQIACQGLWKHPSLHSGLAKMVLYHRALVEKHQRLAGSTITSMPDRGAEGVLSLHDQMMEVVVEGADRLRAARGRPPTDVTSPMQ